jgi:hypothetical protein
VAAGRIKLEASKILAARSAASDPLIVTSAAESMPFVLRS